jgi:hypothetical protein
MIKMLDQRLRAILHPWRMIGDMDVVYIWSDRWPQAYMCRELDGARAGSV